MATAIIMPKQGQSVESCILTELKKRKGDTVAPGDVLFAYETDKASFEEEAVVGGEVLEVFFDEGDEIPVLTNVMVIGQKGESVAGFAPDGTAGSAGVADSVSGGAGVALDGKGGAGTSAPVSQTKVPVAVFEPAPDSVPDKVSAGDNVCGANFTAGVSVVSPRAKVLADRYALDASAMVGSGPGGRVIERDVVAALETSPKTTTLAKAMMREGMIASGDGGGLGGRVRGCDLASGRIADGVTSAGGAGTATVSGGDGSTVVPLSNMRKLIARAMHASLQNSAQLTHHLGADARRIMELRKKAKAAGKDTTLNDIVCFAVVRALRKFPAVNAHFLGDGVRRFDGVHLALAVDTERGLMVPVVRNADGMSIGRLAAGLKEVAAACKKGSINPDLLSPEAASFTVSNLGNYGVEAFTPIINLPQVAILGVNTIVPRPKDLGDGVYGFVPFMGLSLTYDHRALDGGEATRFLKQIAVEIETLDVEI